MLVVPRRCPFQESFCFVSELVLTMLVSMPVGQNENLALFFTERVGKMTIPKTTGNTVPNLFQSP